MNTQTQKQSSNGLEDSWSHNVRHALYNSPLYSPLYLAVYVVSLSAYSAVYFRGIWSYLTLFIVFTLLPLLDFLFGPNELNPTPSQLRKQEKAWYYHYLVLPAVPVQIVLVLWAAYFVQGVALNAFEFLGVALSVGIANGTVGTAAAHELIHKRQRHYQVAAQALLLAYSYMPFFIEHLKLHHVHYGTPKDPTTSVLGQSFYNYFPKTLRGKFYDAWRIEFERLHRKGYARWSWHNQMLWFFALPVALTCALGILWGAKAVLFFLLQSFIAWVTLEVVTYIQHYGLYRKEISPGKYELGGGTHSWDTYLRISNFFFLQLARHYDHHVHMSRWYHVLHSFPKDALLLPAGYPAMCVLALVPPLWRKIMDPIVLRHQLIQSTDGLAEARMDGSVLT